MNLALLTGVALAVPLVVFAGVYYFAKGSVWFSAHPKAWGITCTVLGLAQILMTISEANDHARLSYVVGLLIGVSFIIQGVYVLRSGKPVHVG